MPVFACTAYSIADSVAVNDRVDSYMGCVPAKKLLNLSPKKSKTAGRSISLTSLSFPILLEIFWLCKCSPKKHFLRLGTLVLIRVIDWVLIPLELLFV